MSNRTPEQVTLAARLRVAHLAQIEALTKPGLNKNDRIMLFLKAANIPPLHPGIKLPPGHPFTAAYAVWWTGELPDSLFGNMPGRLCPVNERLHGNLADKRIPKRVERDWCPTAEVLEAFSEVQIAARCGRD